MAKIVSVEQMRAIERAADDSGLSYAQMMENAGRRVAEVILAEMTAVEGKRIAILVGPGNNGGDGLVAGHHLAEAGAQVSAYIVGERAPDDVNLARLQGHGGLIARGDEDQRARVLRNLMATVDGVVDAVLGTGFKLPLRGAAEDALTIAGTALAGRTDRPWVVAVDCPSGVDCDTGETAEATLQADVTVTLAAAKTGLLRFPAAERCGRIVVADIGLAKDQPELHGVQLELCEAGELRATLPRRPRSAHKGTFGRAVVVAGSVNFPGAAVLAGLGAYRVGAGLVTLATPSSIQSMLAPQLPEATWIVLPHELGVLSGDAATVLIEEMGECEALLLGPGFGLDPATQAFLARLLGAGESAARTRIGFVHPEARGAKTGVGLPPCVVDADGLKLLGRIPEWPKVLPAPSVLTPHPGEMAVLTGMSIGDVEGDRVEAARKWSAVWGHVVVLKGAYTVVANPDGRATVIPFATPALARAGTGDVLAGAIVGLMAQGLDAYRAAVLGGYLHGRSGELAAEALGTSASVLAGDVADSLPASIAELESLA